MVVGLSIGRWQFSTPVASVICPAEDVCDSQRDCANILKEALHSDAAEKMMVTERCPERVVGGVVGAKRNREESAGGAPALEWRVLESGVLAVKTPLEVVTVQGTRSVWFEPRKKRLVCPHGWGQYHLSSWNGPRAADFPKPNWTTCDCKSATGLCARKKLREEVLASDARAPSYYETLVATIGVTELRPGLVGARVPGVVGADGGAFYMVKGDAASVLRCRHGQTTHTLGAQTRERQRYAAGLVVAALLGHRIAGKALGGAAGPEGPSASRRARRVLVGLVAALHAARAARRARRGGVVACGCAPVFVKARVKVK